jgi:hypothetical protein
MPPPSTKYVNFAVAALLGLASLAVAHGHDEDSNMNMVGPSMARPTITSGANATVPQTYFRHGELSGLMMAHIFFMTIAWIFVLPIGIQLLITLNTKIC